MSSPLRGAEIDACVHRIALVRAQPTSAQRSAASPELLRRRREADAHRRRVLDAIAASSSDSEFATDHERTVELIARGAELILQPRLADAEGARRTSAVQAFVRVGRSDEGFFYAPLVVKNHEVVETASTRRLLEGSVTNILPNDAQVREALGLRTTPTVRRDALQLAGALRILQSHHAADPGLRGAVIDRSSRLWWLELGTDANTKCNLAAYDRLYEERLGVLEALDRWFDVGGPFPTAPYWHRDCLTCEFAEHCEGELELVDDVSLTRFTTSHQQSVLRQRGVATRLALASLDPLRVQRARSQRVPSDEAFEREDRLSESIDKLDELIYRARAHVSASALRILTPEEMGCATADVEIDVDMESYGDATYLWGATLSLRAPLEGFVAGHVAFAVWDELSAVAAARNFRDFWTWFDLIRQRCHEEGHSFAAYCFWAQAEDGAMNRAVSTPVEGGATFADLEAFRRRTPAEWIDLHEVAKRQIQTEGPLGLKQLAGAAGFEWRDENPSGEASMAWYEVATGDDEVAAAASRARILEYNEDDCRATKALRDWLNGPAKRLGHRDDFEPPAKHR